MSGWLFVLWLVGTLLIWTRYDLYDSKQKSRWAVSTPQNGPGFVLLTLLWAVLIAFSFF
ncbi:hypothetical protein [Peteryoungia ipomoeae]|uniref:hypothetical protein n=1 Tax=Peteryoungia ipomoeae TaxID=1210932 RepID=UPI00145627A1|nr:hypothetical protein [Peteryoungia ipomoeae]